MTRMLIIYLTTIIFRFFSHGIITPEYKHSEKLISQPWENGLREATYRVFAKEGWLEPGLKNELYIAPILGENIPSVPFGDISMLARGQLYHNHGNLIFVRDKNLYDCENCRIQTPLKKYGDILTLWSVRRIRHRRHEDNFRYEVEYKISPVGIEGYIKSNGEFNYEIPGHIFLLNQDIKDPQNGYGDNNNNDRYYLPPYTSTTAVYYYTQRNDRFTTTTTKPDQKSKLEKEIELYNKLLSSLKDHQKIGVTEKSTLPTRTTTTSKITSTSFRTTLKPSKIPMVLRPFMTKVPKIKTKPTKSITTMKPSIKTEPSTEPTTLKVFEAILPQFETTTKPLRTTTLKSTTIPTTTPLLKPSLTPLVTTTKTPPMSLIMSSIPTKSTPITTSTPTITSKSTIITPITTSTPPTTSKSTTITPITTSTPPTTKLTTITSTTTTTPKTTKSKIKPQTTRRILPTKEDFDVIFETKKDKIAQPTTSRPKQINQIQTPDYVATATEGYTVFKSPIVPTEEIKSMINVTLKTGESNLLKKMMRGKKVNLDEKDEDELSRESEITLIPTQVYTKIEKSEEIESRINVSEDKTSKEDKLSKESTIELIPTQVYMKMEEKSEEIESRINVNEDETSKEDKSTIKLIPTQIYMKTEEESEEIESEINVGKNKTRQEDKLSKDLKITSIPTKVYKKIEEKSEEIEAGKNISEDKTSKEDKSTIKLIPTQVYMKIKEESEELESEINVGKNKTRQEDKKNKETKITSIPTKVYKKIEEKLEGIEVRINVGQNKTQKDKLKDKSKGDKVNKKSTTLIPTQDYTKIEGKSVEFETQINFRENETKEDKFKETTHLSYVLPTKSYQKIEEEQEETSILNLTPGFKSEETTERIQQETPTETFSTSIQEEEILSFLTSTEIPKSSLSIESDQSENYPITTSSDFEISSSDFETSSSDFETPSSDFETSPSDFESSPNEKKTQNEEKNKPTTSKIEKTFPTKNPEIKKLTITTPSFQNNLESTYQTSPTDFESSPNEEMIQNEEKIKSTTSKIEKTFPTKNPERKKVTITAPSFQNNLESTYQTSSNDFETSPNEEIAQNGDKIKPTTSKTNPTENPEISQKETSTPIFQNNLESTYQTQNIIDEFLTSTQIDSNYSFKPETTLSKEKTTLPDKNLTSNFDKSTFYKKSGLLQTTLNLIPINETILTSQTSTEAISTKPTSKIKVETTVKRFNETNTSELNKIESTTLTSQEKTFTQSQNTENLILTETTVINEILTSTPTTEITSLSSIKPIIKNRFRKPSFRVTTEKNLLTSKRTKKYKFNRFSKVPTTKIPKTTTIIPTTTQKAAKVTTKTTSKEKSITTTKRKFKKLKRPSFNKPKKIKATNQTNTDRIESTTLKNFIKSEGVIKRPIIKPPTPQTIAVPFTQDGRKIIDDIFGKTSKTTIKTTTKGLKRKQNLAVEELFNELKRKRYMKENNKRIRVKTRKQKISTTSNPIEDETNPLNLNENNMTDKEMEMESTPKIIFSDFYEASTVPSFQNEMQEEVPNVNDVVETTTSGYYEKFLDVNNVTNVEYQSNLEENNYTTQEINYKTEQNDYTTEKNNYTIEEIKYTTEKINYTTEEIKYTTEKINYTTEEIKYTTEENVYTTERNYVTKEINFTTEKNNYEVTTDVNLYEKLRIKATTEDVSSVLDNLVLSVLNNARAVKYLDGKKKRLARKKKRLIKVRSRPKEQ